MNRWNLMPFLAGIRTGLRAAHPSKWAWVLGLALSLSLAVGCASTRERWAEVTMHDLGYQNLYHSVLDLLELEGFYVILRLPDTGRIESEWFRGDSRREVRGPSRRKVHVEIERKKGERAYVVRLRVQEQIIRKGGMLAIDTRDESLWEDYPDSFGDAEFLAAKLGALLADYSRPGASDESLGATRVESYEGEP